MEKKEGYLWMRMSAKEKELLIKKEFISFSALNAEEAFMRFQELDGLRLLNEHS